jgi:hypothetical protein
LIRNGISHVCVFDTQSIASAAASSDEGGWNVLAQIAVELKVTLNTQAPPTH